MTEKVGKVNLTNVRIAFCDSLFVAKKVNNEGDPRHSAVFIIEPKSPLVKTIDNAINAVAAEKWGKQSASVLKDLTGKGRICFLKQAKTNSDGEVYEGFEDMFSINTSSKTRPLIIDRDKTQLDQKDGRPYAGCYVNALVEIWAQDNQFGRRINAQLKGVQFVKDGDAFGGGAPASPDEFEDLGVPEDAEESLV